MAIFYLKSSFGIGIANIIIVRHDVQNDKKAKESVTQKVDIT
jgi:hypothetical protein